MGEPLKDPQRRAAEVLREYATMIEDSELNRSGPLKGRCEPKIEAEISEYRELAVALEARAWIPVTERLPDDDISVMIALRASSDPDDVWIGWHDGEMGWVCDNGPLGDRVTHWMPMPEGPRG